LQFSVHVHVDDTNGESATVDTGPTSRNIKMIIQFDGTDFCGWQLQDDVRTVQGVLGDAIRELTGTAVTLHSSSRTDSGVHALAMPVGFQLDSNLPIRAFHRGLNSLLPRDLKVVTAEDAAPDFHTRYMHSTKSYRYRILNHQTALPLERRHSWHVPQTLDVEAMESAAECLVGHHDFSSYRSVHCDAHSAVRTVDCLDVAIAEPHLVTLYVRAGGFLRNMVRIIAGTLVQVGLGRFPPGWVREVLEARDRTRAGPTAPPQGLFLVEVVYHPTQPPQGTPAGSPPSAQDGKGGPHVVRSDGPACDEHHGEDTSGRQ